MPQRRKTGGGVDWFPQQNQSSPGAVGANGNATLMDEALTNPVTSQNYSAGAIVGLRLWASVTPVAVIEVPPVIYVGILPNGMAVPTLADEQDLKQQERFLWAQLMLVPTAAGSATLGAIHYVGSLELRSSRRFDPGDRLIVVMRNPGAVAFGATSEANVLVDAYIRED